MGRQATVRSIAISLAVFLFTAADGGIVGEQACSSSDDGSTACALNGAAMMQLGALDLRAAVLAQERIGETAARKMMVQGTRADDDNDEEDVGKEVDEETETPGSVPIPDIEKPIRIKVSQPTGSDLCAGKRPFSQCELKSKNGVSRGKCVPNRQVALLECHPEDVKDPIIEQEITMGKACMDKKLDETCSIFGAAGLCKLETESYMPQSSSGFSSRRSLAFLMCKVFGEPLVDPRPIVDPVGELLVEPEPIVEPTLDPVVQAIVEPTLVQPRPIKPISISISEPDADDFCGDKQPFAQCMSKPSNGVLQPAATGVCVPDREIALLKCHADNAEKDVAADQEIKMGKACFGKKFDEACSVFGADGYCRFQRAEYAPEAEVGFSTSRVLSFLMCEILGEPLVNPAPPVQDPLGELLLDPKQKQAIAKARSVWIHSAIAKARSGADPNGEPPVSPNPIANSSAPIVNSSAAIVNSSEPLANHQLSGNATGKTPVRADFNGSRDTVLR